MSFQWNGDAIIKRVQKAEEAGLKDTADEVVTEAQRRVRKKSYALNDSIQVQDGGPKRTADGYSVEVGSDDPETAPHGAIQELGPADGRAYSFTPYIVPAVETEGSKLGENIKSHL